MKTRGQKKQKKKQKKKQLIARFQLEVCFCVYLGYHSDRALLRAASTESARNSFLANEKRIAKLICT